MSSLIFIADLAFPLGVAGGVPYILVVLLSLRHRDSQLPLWTAAGCSFLTILGVVFSPPGGELWKVLINRGLALFAIWTTTLMGRFQLEQAGTIQMKDKTLQDFMNIMPSACFSFNHQGTILSWNPAAEKMYGYSAQEAIGALNYDLLGTPETYEKTKKVIDNIFQGKTAEDQIWHDRNKQGERGWRAGSLFPVCDSNGRVAYGINFAIDITAQKNAEAALQTQKTLLESILNSSPDAIYAKDHTGKYLLANQAAADLMGHPTEVIPGMDDAQLFGADNAKALKQFDEMVLHHQDALTYEGEISHDGHQRVFSSTKSRLKDAAGVTLGLVGVSRDITEWKQVQTDLLLTDRVFMASPDHISILGRDYRYRRVNASYLRVHQKLLHEIIGLSVADLLGQEVFEQTIQPMLDRCFNGEEVHYEAWFTFADNQRRFMDVSYLPLTQGARNIQEIVVIGKDLTERKQMEEALQESEQRFRTMFEQAAVGVAQVESKTGKFVKINQRYCDITGYSQEEMQLKTFQDITHPDDLEADLDNLKSLVSGGITNVSREKRYIRADGKIVWINLTISRMWQNHDEPSFYIAVAQDISERKSMEEDLRKTESTLKSFFDSAPMMMGVVEVTSNDVRHLSDNQATANFYGKPEGGTTGKWCSQLGMPQEVMQTWIKHYQLSLKNHQPISFEYAHPVSQGTRWVAATVTPVFFKDSSLPRCAYIAQDITERKTMEDQVRSHAEELEKEVERRTTRIQELEQRRMQVEKLAALAQIAAGVAHEINNPLASISQSLVLLKRALPPEHPHFRYMAKVEDCIDRIAQITKRLYQLYRPNSPTPTPIDLRMCIQTAIEIMQKRTIKQGIEVKVPPIPRAILTPVSQGELIQVLCNLIHNAIDASSPNGTIEVNLATDQETVSLFVTDQGLGIPPEAAPHIFEPFYTTKEYQTEGGLGLGLSISHSLVDSMGGTLDFSTTIGHGSTFRITLPLTTS
jgi:PAS domain S-box-containing protein